MTVRPTILIVEHNPTTRKLLRVVLQREGYAVREALDGSSALTMAAQALPDLVLHDLMLPDMDGLTLLDRLRALPGGTEIPIIGISGFLSRLDESRTLDAPFTALLVKPLDYDSLTGTIRAHLPSRIDRAMPVARPGHVLVVDDDPVQLKLTRLLLAKCGFDVTAAASAADAIREAEARTPDAILSDVSMPDMDGFDLCRAIRRHATLAHVPIVLMSGRNGSEADRELARTMGANALLRRTVDVDDIAAAIDSARRQGARPASDANEQLQLRHARLVIQQLERQVAVTAGLTQRCTLQATQLSLLSGMADALMHRTDIDSALEDVLGATLDAAGIAKGALLLKQPTGSWRLHPHVGFSPDERQALAGFFGHQDLLERIVERGASVVAPSPDLEGAAARAILDGAHVTSAQIVPLVSDGRGVGAMFIGADRTDVTSADSVAFARAMGNQVVQSLELAKSVAQLAESEKRYRTLLEGASDAIAVLTSDGLVREMNHRWTEILGQPASALIGRDIREFVPPRHGVRGHPILDRAARPGPIEVPDAAGSTVLLEFSNTTIEVGGETLIFTVGRDVTEQRQLEDQLRQAQKLEGIGQLAGGIAHDFNNLLTVILSFGEILASSMPADSPEREDVLEIVKAGQRAASLTQQLLAFSRKQILQPRVLDINDVVDEVRPLLRRLIPEHVDLDVSLSPAAGLIKIDPTQIEQILMNLTANAADAMPRGGRLTIGTSRVRQQDRDFVLLSVADTGTGMDDVTAQRIFEPFFTTKEVGKGTGLGLSTVHGIVKQSGGDIDVRTAMGRGTTFRILLPSANGDATFAAPDGAAVSAGREVPRGSGTVFVVEDDAGVRLLVRLTLERAGYRVIEAGSPKEAREVITTFAQPIDMLLSDVIMPDSEGPPLYESLATRYPGLRVLYISGYADEAILKQGLLTEGTPFLQKPFTPVTLARKVREVLVGAPPRRG